MVMRPDSIVEVGSMWWSCDPWLHCRGWSHNHIVLNFGGSKLGVLKLTLFFHVSLCPCVLGSRLESQWSSMESTLVSWAETVPSCVLITWLPKWQWVNMSTIHSLSSLTPKLKVGEGPKRGYSPPVLSSIFHLIFLLFCSTQLLGNLYRKWNFLMTCVPCVVKGFYCPQLTVRSQRKGHTDYPAITCILASKVCCCCCCCC